MLQIVEAEIDIDDNVRLLEPLRVTRKARAIVTVLEESNGGAEKKGNLKKILELLKSPEVASRKTFSAEEIETQIEEAMNS